MFDLINFPRVYVCVGRGGMWPMVSKIQFHIHSGIDSELTSLNLSYNNKYHIIYIVLINSLLIS